MDDAYRGCDRYKDEGVVENVMNGSHGRFGSRLKFSTAFMRPNRFRFEFSSSVFDAGGEQQYVVWADAGQPVRSWWTIRPRVEVHESISRALAGPTGVSFGAAFTVPMMLLGERGPARQLGRGALERLPDEAVQERSCYVVRSRGQKGDETWWVDSSTFLLRKIVENDQSTDVSAVTTTTYDPNCGAEIDPARFTFVPP